MNYKQRVNEQVIEEPNYFKGTVSPTPTVLSDGSQIVYLYDQITPQSINRVISEILPLIGNGNGIQLRLKTFGGSLYDSLALIDIIKQYDIPVHVDGYAMSGGFLIFAASCTRTMSPYSYLMYHDMSYGIYASKESHRNELEHSDDLTKTYHKLICENTLITPKMLKSYDEKSKDWYINYEEAKKLGLITQELKEIEIDVPAAPARKETIIEYVPIEISETKKTK